MIKDTIKLLLSILLVAISSLSVSAMEVSEQQALELCKSQFGSEWIDFYVKKDSISDAWTFFVDAEPTKNWEHDCYLITISKNGPVVDATLIKNIQKLKFPPKDSYNYEPIDVSVNVPVKYGHTPNIQASPMPRSGHVAHRTCCRTHAVIISGGIDQSWNYNRYWNDCSLIYQTLSKRYLIHKENIIPIIADGEIQAGSMVKEDQEAPDPVPNDLDMDGKSEYLYAATKYNVNETFRILVDQMDTNDHLFVYVIDHGGYDENKDEAHICLWGEDTLTSPEFRDLIIPFVDKKINVSVVMGQCHSGGFAKDLLMPGVVFAAACQTRENSNVMFFPTPPLGQRYFPYDEFVYQWTCAVNGATPFGEAVNADYDGDGNVTMEEAFRYAQENDRLTTEHPLYTSFPEALGRSLSFYTIPFDYGLSDGDLSDNTPLSDVMVVEDGQIIHVYNNSKGELSVHLVSYDKLQTVSVRLLEAGAEFFVDKSILDAGMYILSVYDKSELKSSYKFTIR